MTSLYQVVSMETDMSCLCGVRSGIALPFKVLNFIRIHFQIIKFDFPTKDPHLSFSHVFHIYYKLKYNNEVYPDINVY